METRRRPARDRLLEAADALMFVDGVVLTPVDDIVRRAGAAPASLYANFGNKDGLLTAALERRLEQWTQAWDEALEAAASPTERLLAIFPALQNYQRERLRERWCAFSGTAASSSSPSEQVAAVLAAEDDLLRRRTTELATQIVGERGPQLAEQVIVAYLGTLSGMLRSSHDLAIAAGEETARTVVESFVAAP